MTAEHSAVPAMHARRWGAERGTSVLEALVALGLLSTWFVALTALPISTMRATNTAGHVTAAVTLAGDKMEELQNADYADVASGSDASKMTADGTAKAAGAYTRSWTVASGPIDGTKDVTVKVAWNDGSSRDVELRTLLKE